MTERYGSAENAGPDAEHARFVHDRIPYQLGALEAEEMAAYEAHERDCRQCRDAAAESDQLIGTLTSLHEADWVIETPPDTLLPRLLREVRREQTLRRRRGVLRSGIAACVAGLIVGLVVGFWPHEDQRGTAVGLTPVAGTTVGIDATVALAAHGSGTSLVLVCRDRGAGGYSNGSGDYWMRVVNRAGQRQDLAWWPAPPGREITIGATTNWPRSQITTVQILDHDGKAVLSVGL
jgi:hypothetical protein